MGIRLLLTGCMSWTLASICFLIGYFLPTSNPDRFAYIFLYCSIPFSVMIAARFYYAQGAKTHGLVLGVCMFVIGGCLDAIFTVPIFILPAGGTYIEFYTDLSFWTVGLEFVASASLYWYLVASKQDEQEYSEIPGTDPPTDASGTKPKA